MNFAIAALPHGAKTIFWGGARLRTIRAKRSTFIGFSKAAVFMACRSYRHPSQPGNSKAQNSPCDPLAITSTDAVSNRHLNGTRVSWFITHARVSGGSATELSVTDECQGRSGDGYILLQPASCSVINIAHCPNKKNVPPACRDRNHSRQVSLSTYGRMPSRHGGLSMRL